MSDDERLLPWTIRASTYRIDEPFLRLRSDRVELPDGTIIDGYFVRETRGFAIVAAITPEQRIVLVRQYKHGIGRVTLELPAGTLDRGETPAACAVRELAEETGYAGDPPQLLRSLYADPTSSDGSFHVYLIENATLQFEQSLDPTESIVIETADAAGVRRTRARRRDRIGLAARRLLPRHGGAQRSLYPIRNRNR